MTDETEDKLTPWQRMQEERRAEQASEAEPDALAGARRAELLRCAEAFERTAARLREIVGAAD